MGPIAALSVTEQRDLHERVRALAAAGTAVIYITHHLAEIAAICDRVVALREGRIAGEFSAPIEPSAVVTAMLGAFWLDRLGLLQLDLVYLPETFVVPQAVGGVLFGAGFLVAGLCPGTSCVAAAAGRRDGVAVMAGMLLGVWVFNLAFDWIAPIYSATPLGAVRLTDVAGINLGAGVAAVTAVAIAGFVVANRLERGRA